MKFYATEQLGTKRFKTPEGFLVCQDVPLARTGKQVYGPGDGNPIPPGPDGLIHVERTPEEVFSEKTLASANGKDVVNEHPIDDVMPHNYRELTCGVILNPRRGEGDQSDLMIGDLMVKEPQCIRDIENGKRELSLGYDAEYVRTGIGEGKQTKIIVNHVALVERGRCGYRCSIGDRAIEETPVTPEPEPSCGCNSKENPVTVKKSLKDRVLDALKGKVTDEAMKEIGEAVEKAKDSEGGSGGDVHVHLAPGPAGEKVSDSYCTKDEFEAHKAENAADHQKIRDEMNAMAEKFGKKEEPAKTDPAKEGTAEEKSEMAEEAETKAPTKDAAIAARDSAFLEDSFAETMAGAEILVPGIKPPMTFDKAMAPVITYRDGICALRRSALEQFYTDAKGRAFIDQMLSGRTFNVRDAKAMSCSRVADMFRGAVAMKKAINNGQIGDLTLVKPSDLPSSGSHEAISAQALADQASAAWKH